MKKALFFVFLLVQVLFFNIVNATASSVDPNTDLCPSSSTNQPNPEPILLPEAIRNPDSCIRFVW